MFESDGLWKLWLLFPLPYPHPTPPPPVIDQLHELASKAMDYFNNDFFLWRWFAKLICRCLTDWFKYSTETYNIVEALILKNHLYVKCTSACFATKTWAWNMLQHRGFWAILLIWLQDIDPEGKVWCIS